MLHDLVDSSLEGVETAIQSLEEDAYIERVVLTK
jgi:hypothetical protein